MFHESHGQPVVYVDRAVWHDVAAFLRDEQQFTQCMDVTVVDHLARRTSACTSRASTPERFEIVANFLSHPRNRRIRTICEVPADDPTVASITDLYPGVNFAEREAYDLFGIDLRGSSRPRPHPHARRLGRPPAPQGRRAGTRAGHVQGRPGAAMSDRQSTRTDRTSAPSARSRRPALEAQTDEGAQEMRRRAHDAEVVVIGGGLWPEDDETMIINMGPQHPSTHGVLRVMLELDGETVLRAKPVIGYLHTGMEKTGEELTYVQGATNVTRMDYLAPLVQRARVLDGRRAARSTSRCPARDVDPHVPRRAEPHLVASAVPGDERHGPRRGVDDALRLARPRETLRYLEKITGLRMNHNFIRPGGVAADLPDDWAEDTLELCDDRREGRRATTPSCSRRTRSGSSAPSASA